MGAPLPQFKRDYITNLLAMGNTKPEIIAKFKERYGHAVHPTTIIRLKKQNKAAIADAHDLLAVGSEIVGAAAIKQKTLRVLDKRLDRAIEDETEVDKLRAQLRAGEITKQKFDQECERYEVLTINELVKVTDSMHNQLKGSGEEAPLTPADQAALQLLVEGLKTGNPMQLVQVLNPTQKVFPNGENPVPQADSPQSVS